MIRGLSVSEDGALISPVVHDSRLVGLLISGKELLLLIEPLEGTRFHIVLKDVERLRVDDFREGNIILDIAVYRGSEIEIEDVAYVHGLENEGLQSGGFLKETMQTLAERNIILVKVHPTYGCSLVCLCRDIGIADHFDQTLMGEKGSE